jgi:lipopolysaccharide transport system permease protein
MFKSNSRPALIIAPDRIQKEYVKDLFRFRELFYFMAWRDIVVRYKQTFLGVLWAIVRPLITMSVFAFVFGKVAKLQSEDISYPLFVLSGILPWTLFANSIVDTSNSLILHSNMISKIYFPRVILPVSVIMAHCVDFFISLAVFLPVVFLTGLLPGWHAAALPAFIMMGLLFCTGAGMWLSAISVRYRDFRFLVPFLVQFGVFISPVGYSSFLVSDAYRWLYFLNPMAGIIEGFRWSCFGIWHPDLPLAVALSCAVNGALFISGFRFFRKMETVCADII